LIHNLLFGERTEKTTKKESEKTQENLSLAIKAFKLKNYIGYNKLHFDFMFI
jgi:hypothetical protein